MTGIAVTGTLVQSISVEFEHCVLCVQEIYGLYSP